MRYASPAYARPCRCTNGFFVRLGYRPPPGSLAAEAQSAADRHAEAIATKSLARAVQSEEHHALGHRPPAGSAAAVAQSLADKNEADGGERKLGEGGL